MNEDGEVRRWEVVRLVESGVCFSESWVENEERGDDEVLELFGEMG